MTLPHKLSVKKNIAHYNNRLNALYITAWSLGQLQSQTLMYYHFVYIIAFCIIFSFLMNVITATLNRLIMIEIGCKMYVLQKDLAHQAKD